MLRSVNLGYLFNKGMYDIKNRKLTVTKESTDRLLAAKLSDYSEMLGLLKERDLDGFTLKTQYPGFLCGTGYSHGADGSSLDFKMGFFFDYTTGLPVIPGSSIKGVLRSAFNLGQDGKAGKEYIKSILEGELKISGLEHNDIIELERAIFDGVQDKRQMPIYQRDIFYDGFILTCRGQDRFLGDDYITPHPNPWEEPKPLRFLRVLPEVEFRLDFTLHDYYNSKVAVSKQQKCHLFKSIIRDLGLGAKTSVGYGRFEIF